MRQLLSKLLSYYQTLQPRRVPANLALPRHPTLPEKPDFMERGSLSLDLSEERYHRLTTADRYFLRRFLEA